MSWNLVLKVTVTRFPHWKALKRFKMELPKKRWKKRRYQVKRRRILQQRAMARKTISWKIFRRVLTNGVISMRLIRISDQVR